MGYTVIIAEKPSVASGIAKIVGANTPHRDKANGYLEGNGYRVTWGFGHLVGLDKPEEMGFPGGALPIIPERWSTHVIVTGKGDMDRTVARQMDTLSSLFKGADRIINATDAGREGELIFRYIYEYLDCRKPFDRLWISSLTDEAIRKGMTELLPGSRMENLSDAAHARSEADWLVGFNASRALRIASGFKGNLSLGRVQTPVLGMICTRTEANRDFKPTPFWQITALVHKDMTNFRVLSERKYPTEAQAAEALEAVNGSKRMKVLKVEKKTVTSKPPLLYDLTALQRAANSRLGLTAEETLKVAQSLYEKKYLSYPRTGSRYIPEDVFRTIPSLIRKAESNDRFAEAARSLGGKKLCRRSVDDSKVTDHHALLPTEVFPTDLSGNELKIWEMVCGRMLEAFGEDSLSDRTTVSLECAGVPFKAGGSVLVKAGWKAVFGVAEANEEEKKKEDAESDESENGTLPELAEGEVLPAAKTEILRKTDKPLPLYTDASLLGEMETCGKKIEDEELRESMKDVGLGTPATRAATIETLIKRGYVVRNAKKLTPTELGEGIWKIVRGRKIADVRTTGEWEKELHLVETGQMDKATFDRKIRDYVLAIIEDIRANCTALDGLDTGGEPQRNCPLCGRRMKNLKFSVICDPEDGGCGLKIPREVAGKKLPASSIDALASGKDTPTIKGFTSKSGKKFDARLTLDRENRKVSFVLGEKPQAPTMAGRRCPCCGGPLKDDPWKLTCECGFILFKTQCEVNLTESQIDALLSGQKVAVRGMKSKKGNKFNATLYVNREGKKTAFLFDDAKKK